MALHPTGSTRKLDRLGRVIIPIDVREAMNLAVGDMMEVYVDLNPGGEITGVYFTKYARGCHFCGSLNDLKPFGGHMLCASCREQISEMPEP